MSNKIDLKVVGSVIKGIVGIVSSIAALKVMANESTTIETKVTYSDAVGAILNCSMMGDDKAEAVSGLKMGQDSDFYEAVINVTKSSLYSSHKLNTIQELCKNVEEA